MDRIEDLEVEIKGGESKAVIEGKTAVPFNTFVKLILQKKVTGLLKDWGKAPVILNSELLTNLASAPQDSQENRSKLVLVTFGAGIVGGVFGFCVLQIGLLTGGISFGRRELLYIVGSIVGLWILFLLLARVQRRQKSDTLLESMEQLSNLLSKR